MPVPFRLPALNEVRDLGRTLRAVDPRLLKDGAAGTTRWWTGGEPYLEVTVEKADAVVTGVDVSLRGHVLRFRRGAGLTTGRTDEHEIASGAPSSRLVANDAVARADVVAAVVALLSSSGDAGLVEAAGVVDAASAGRAT